MGYRQSLASSVATNSYIGRYLQPVKPSYYAKGSKPPICLGNRVKNVRSFRSNASIEMGGRLSRALFHLHRCRRQVVLIPVDGSLSTAINKCCDHVNELRIEGNYDYYAYRQARAYTRLVEELRLAVNNRDPAVRAQCVYKILAFFADADRADVCLIKNVIPALREVDSLVGPIYCMTERRLKKMGLPKDLVHACKKIKEDLEDHGISIGQICGLTRLATTDDLFQLLLQEP